MALEVRPLADGDVEKSVRIQYLAFRNPTGIDMLFSPHDEPPEETLIAGAKDRRKQILTSKTARFVSVVEAETREIIAAVHYDVYPEERTDEQMKQLTKVPPPPPEAHPDAWNDFFGHFSAERKKLGNRPIVIVHSLVTHPDHQRRGAGKLLLQKLVNEADAEGLEVYLEASQLARPLYAKYGFVPGLVKVFDLQRYGREGQEVNTVRNLLCFSRSVDC